MLETLEKERAEAKGLDCLRKMRPSRPRRTVIRCDTIMIDENMKIVRRCRNLEVKRCRIMRIDGFRICKTCKMKGDKTI